MLASYELGVSPDQYVTLVETLPEYDKNKNGTHDQSELKNAIDSMGKGLSKKEKAVLWQMFAKTDKATNNPYDIQTGEKAVKVLEGIREDMEEEKEKSKEQEPEKMPKTFSDEIMEQIIANIG